MGTVISAARGAHLLFTSDWTRLLDIMSLLEGRQSSAQGACYLPSVSRYPFIHQEQVREKGPAKGHRTQPAQVSTSRPWDYEFRALLLSYACHVNVIKANKIFKMKCIVKCKIQCSSQMTNLWHISR